MKNTYINLDIIYLDNGFRVNGVLENLQSHDLTSRGIPKKSKYFIEVNSGYIKRNNVKEGD